MYYVPVNTSLVPAGGNVAWDLFGHLYHDRDIYKYNLFLTTMCYGRGGCRDGGGFLPTVLGEVDFAPSTAHATLGPKHCTRHTGLSLEPTSKVKAVIAFQMNQP
jgi:hypothetical protein